ncbi:MAG: phosphate acyltransferase PlsX [Rhodospirillales bacterium]|nr:phosphate acyltransferase PlsX [Rhodospirillales bacterium]
MTTSLTLSIDAMGGDNAPDMVIDGVEAAARQNPKLRFLLYGDETRLNDILQSRPAAMAASEVRHAPDVIGSGDKPAVALRAGRQSSMRLAINAVGDGEADAVVSAGNTGALMAMAKFVLKTLPGIDRPAIATYFPTMRRETVMLDLGANIECDADNLLQFAVMGEVFARNVLGCEHPRVGILNVGAEDMKGNQAVRGAAELLQQTNLPIRFHGFVEGDDIAKGTVDVIVTDGFTGNVALKTAEGMASMFGHFLRSALTSSVFGKLGALIARPALLQFKKKFDPRLYNGAMFVGLNGICVKSHGGTDGIGFANAIGVAVNLVRNNFNEGIKEDCAQLLEDRDNAQIGGDADDVEKPEAAAS